MLSIPCLLYWPHEQQTCWHRTPLNEIGTVLVDEDLNMEGQHASCVLCYEWEF
jgi:hypothetical protein